MLDKAQRHYNRASSAPHKIIVLTGHAVLGLGAGYLTTDILCADVMLLWGTSVRNEWVHLIMTNGLEAGTKLQSLGKTLQLQRVLD